MAEYRRWISYIYTYENGEKRQNAGYVRSELRNGQVRITLYMDTKPEKEELYVCAYRVHGEQSEGIQLGRLQLCTGKEEFRIEQEAECFTEGEWKFKQVIQNGGLLIFPKKAVGQAEYFAAAWGTGNLNGEQAEQIMKVLREGTDKRGTVEEKEEEPKEEITEEKRKETKNEEPKREEEKREETKNEEPKREEEKREETKNEELKRGKEKREETKNEELKREEEKKRGNEERRIEGRRKRTGNDREGSLECGSTAVRRNAGAYNRREATITARACSSEKCLLCRGSEHASVLLFGGNVSV